MKLRRRDIVAMGFIFCLWRGRELIQDLFSKNIEDIEVEYEEVKPSQKLKL